MIGQTEQVLALAPDEASAAAGRKVAKAAAWKSLGHSVAAVWGTCQGSGKEPYLTRIDLSEPAFKCSCPSRKFPCKHALGLFLLYVESPTTFSAEPPPDWVAEWLAGRQKRAEKKQEKAASHPESVVDPCRPEAGATAEKRLQKREARVDKGFEDLAQWLRDLVRTGLAQAQKQGYGFWDSFAKRMVDAQSPGIARYIQRLAAIPHSNFPDWHMGLLHKLALLHLAVEGWSRRHTLDAPLLADLRAFIGFPQDKDAAPANAAVSDDWLVVGQRIEEEGAGLRSQRTWLTGRETGRFALILQFAHRSSPGFEFVMLPGRVYRGEAAFFLSALALRAVPKNLILSAEEPFVPSGSDIDGARAQLAEALARCVWIEQFPMLLDDVRLARQGEEWVAVDSRQDFFPLAIASEQAWEIIAGSGGGTVQLFGEWVDERLQVLSHVAPARRRRYGECLPMWTELCKQALIGTERANPGGLPASSELKQLLPSREEASAEEQLLTHAAILAVRRQAGGRARKWTGRFFEPAPEEELPEAPPGASRLLRQIVLERSRFKPNVRLALLLEWQRHALRTRCLVPRAILPFLLDEAAREKSLCDYLRTTGGRSAAWLARLNCDAWGWFAADPNDEQMWEDGTFEQRVKHLKTLRKTDPAQARDKLQSVVARESAANRLKLVETLSRNPSAEDGPFLDSLLDDRSKGVRAAAARMLAAIPGSALSQRMLERTKVCVTLETGLLKQKLNVALPETLDEVALRDTLDLGKTDGGKGKRAARLQRLIALTPLSFWDDLIKGKELLVKLILANEWKESLFDGLASAILTQQRTDWALLCINHSKTWDLTESINDDLFTLLPLKEREAWLLKYSTHAKPEALVNGGWALTARLCGMPFSEELSIQTLKKVLGNFSLVNYRDYAIAIWFDVFAFHGAPTQYPLARQLAEPWIAPESPFQKMAQEFLSIYEFRHTMHREFFS